MDGTTSEILQDSTFRLLQDGLLSGVYLAPGFFGLPLGLDFLLKNQTFPSCFFGVTCSWVVGYLGKSGRPERAGDVALVGHPHERADGAGTAEGERGAGPGFDGEVRSATSDPQRGG